MNRRTKRYFVGLLVTVMLTIAMAFQAFAARIAFSDPSGNVGDEITVTMKITSTGDETINSSDVMLAYNSSSLEFISGTGATGGAGSIRVVGNADNPDSKELAFTLKFKALKPGSSKITVSTQEVYDKDSQIVTIDREGNSTITIAGSATDSANAALSELQIAPGNLSPSFSADVTEYTATVSGDVEKIVVSAAAQDAGATVNVTGNEGLQIGQNQVVCTVMAQNGQAVKTYTINVTKVEGTADENSAAAAAGVPLKTPQRVITVLPAGDDVQIPEGFSPCSVSIDGHDVQGWVWAADTEPRYCVFYAMNEDGVKDFYRYDLTEKTLQRYFEDPASGKDSVSMEQYVATAEEYNSLLHDYNVRFWIIIGLIVLSAILLIAVIVLVMNRGPKDDFIERKEDREDYPRKAARERKQERGKERVKERRITREERYLQDLEEEEEAAAEEEQVMLSQDRTADVDSKDDEDDDFEFIDLGL